MNPSDFRKRFTGARKKKESNWETLYREAMELFCPDREHFYRSIPGEKKGRQVYTSSPYIALDKAANNLHSSLTPHMKRWADLKPGRLIPEESRDDAAVALKEIRDTLFDHIFSSNFDLAVSEMYRDIMFGTAALMVSGTPKEPLIFTSVPLNELYITTGELGVVSGVFRRYKVKVGTIMATWDDAKMPQDLQELAKDDPEKEFWCIEGSMPKRIKVFDSKIEKEKEVDGYGYYVLLEKYSGAYLVERDMPMSPWIVPRWSVMSGEEWGRGPAIICLNDAKTLNQFIKLHMQSMELTVHPMYTVVDDGVINISAIRIGPGAMIPVSANDGVFGASIQPLRSGGNIQAGQIEIQRLEQSINDQMYTDPLGSVNLPVKTATEISIRQQDLAKRIGSAYGRLQYEFIKPLLNLCLYQLDRFNIISMNDYKVDGHNIAIEAVSPLAQAQQQDEINNVIRYVEFGMAAFGPEIGLTLMKPEEILSFVGEELNLPPNVKMTDAEKKQSRDMLQSMMLQQEMQNVAGAEQQQGQVPQQ